MKNVVIFHGGGGPATVANLVGHFSERSKVLAPTLPGWNGTARKPEQNSVAAFADGYVRYMEEHDLHDALVIGSSIGGWIAAELALRDDGKRIGKLVLINSGGIEVPGQPIANISGLAPPEIAKLSFHDPSKLVLPPPTPERIAMLRANQATLAAITSDPYMCDPTLIGRLAGIRVPTLVVWGEADRVMTADYGRAFAAAIPGARFELIRGAGHLPHLEQPAATFAAIDAFA